MNLRTPILAITVLALTLIGLGNTPVQADSGGITLSATKLDRPEMTAARNCATTYVTIVNTNGTQLVSGSWFDLYYTIKSQVSTSTEFSGNSSFVYSSNSSPAPSSTRISILICNSDLALPVITEPANRVAVRVVERLNSREVTRASIEIPIVDKSPEEIAINSLRKNCINGFGINTVLQQKLVPKISGKSASISGTLFRSGFVSPNDLIKFFQEVPRSNGTIKLVLLGTARTSDTGEFTFKFKMKRTKKEIITTVRMNIPARDSIGPLVGPYEKSTVLIPFEWGKKGAKYNPMYNPYDWVPVNSESCMNTYYEYLNIPNKILNDDRNRLLTYALGKNFPGSANKERIQATSLSESTGNGSLGKCYVSGYYTKKGTYVRGYMRKC
jgi:hypothetical protein